MVKPTELSNIKIQRDFKLTDSRGQNFIDKCPYSLLNGGLCEKKYELGPVPFQRAAGLELAFHYLGFGAMEIK
jgi:hypothetical protein